jgi:hypothetical protein
MKSLANKKIAVEISDDAGRVCLTDVVRGLTWVLNPDTRLVSSGIERFEQEPYACEQIGRFKDNISILRNGQAKYSGSDTIITTWQTPFGPVRFLWKLKADRLELYAESDGDDCPGGLALPGCFEPQDGSGYLCAIPNGQGILHTGKGPAFYLPKWGWGTDGFTLSMFGQITDKSALLSIVETDADAVLHWEKTSENRIRVFWRQEPSMGTLRYTRQAVFFLTEPNLTSLCKQYRSYEIEKNRFKSWEEKIESRPILSELFGSAVIFTGYCYDSKTDYAASLKKLKSLGIDKAFVYPLLYHINLPKDNVANIPQPNDERMALAELLQELDYLGGSFIYLNDMPTDDPKRLILDNKGNPKLYWQMKGVKWYCLNGEEKFSQARQIIDDHHSQLQGIHYDVLTCPPAFEDYHPAHLADGKADLETRRKILDYTTEAGLLVASEGFNGRMSSHYDLGSTKYSQALGGDEYCIVPMTMLVYHDSAYHTWWELDNYDNPEHLCQYGKGYLRRFPWGGGNARLQSAMDALMGTLPDLFPFGMQYNLIPHSTDLYYYKRSLDDPAVREAIECAKPVMALNRRIGKLEIIAHKLHRSDGAIQETVFTDGTRVVANFANVALESLDAELLPPQSWKCFQDNG